MGVGCLDDLDGAAPLRARDRHGACEADATQRFGDDFRAFLKDEHARYQTLLGELGLLK